jgi:hypothetical protein
MHKEKSKKTTRTVHSFPEGKHFIWFGPSEEEKHKWFMGVINLISLPTTDPEGDYVGAIQFNKDVGEIGELPFPLEVEFHPWDGAIQFHVKGATGKFPQPVPPEYQFMFDGFTDGEDLWGIGGVPESFIPPDPPAEPGEPVTWTSRGPGDEHPKPSK